MGEKMPFVHYGEEAPCRDCDKREEGCHSRCDEYKTWRARRDECIESERKRKRELLNPRYVEKYSKKR